MTSALKEPSTVKKIAAITGALGDIGQALAVEFSRRGFAVALCDLAEESSAANVLRRLHDAGCTALFYRQVNVQEADAVHRWLEAIEVKWGVPQVLVPNAGIVKTGELTGELSIAQAREQMEVNFWGSYHVAVAGARRLKELGLSGHITFIGSWAAERPATRIAAYGISKAALRMLCKTLALELAAHRILVNEVAPGIVDGGLSKKNQAANPALLSTHLQAIPVHQLTAAEEVAKQVGWLSDVGNTSITGSTVLIDGGLSLTSKMTP